ncbi:hypothetical protein SAMN05444156_0642 [Verrucomicrobium sp. GAS474]|uniref:hypothetical protein n=1 Tax=Verrucomicrobium sp. GAS474 TaxID=1882831 RepID=UPI00087A73DF|nr:hypothetical protein [Verrucomicrobium sp. GAS474]SDT90876.1 hypothetical protein SAMN05444156_0642 [Verrucomicrobium sp. GAS474]
MKTLSFPGIARRFCRVTGAILLTGAISLGVASAEAVPLSTASKDSRILHVERVFLAPYKGGVWVSGYLSKTARQSWVSPSAHVHIEVLNAKGKILWDKPENLNTYILNYPPREGGRDYLHYGSLIDKLPEGAASVVVVCHTDGHVH